MTTPHVPFRQIFEDCRREAAEAAWQRARLASWMRHSAAKHGRRKAARRLAQIKKDAVRRVLELLPREVAVSMDNGRQHVGLLSVRWPGHGAIRLPAQSRLSSLPIVLS
jgi:hypothetical protein